MRYLSFSYKLQLAMRYIMKGGVWKNSEDEILKAAIMKYGLNQWSRISSLLQRKSAKQCKQRWYEWLDPSIKKTQWSRAEDEKLLQLARVFPSQWRTIAPFVGRTPTQCFERYEKLLDIAQGKSPQESEDLKKLRPGEIDPNPETKPARLDPIDMDEDEKEMLAEVRVRLANTKGKKAKRKEREKIIEQARRLAQLQKLRELEMAGVDNIPTQKELKRMRQKQDIDYNKDIPFKREVPEFVYKLESTEATKNNFFASTISLQTLEGKRRDVEEQLQRKLDKKRLKKLKDRDYKSMLDIKNSFDKPVSAPISLPEPQLNERDLEDMKKYNITTPLNSMLIHNSTPANMTPENKVMLAAKINFSLNHRDMNTPIAEENEEQDPLDGVEGLNYLKEMQRKERDPKRLRSVDRIISERVKTPSANEWEHEQDKVKNLLKGLSRPENTIQFEIPEEDEEEEEENQIIDAEELERKEQQIARVSEQLKFQSRTQALKRGLPRALNVPSSLHPSSSQSQEADRLIEEELLSMLYSDAIDYPLSAFSLPEEHRFVYLTPISKEARQEAAALIAEQCDKIEMVEECNLDNLYEEAKSHVKLNFSKKEAVVTKAEVKQKDRAVEQYKNALINLPKYRDLEKSNETVEKKVKKYLLGFERLISAKTDEINELERELESLTMQRRGLEVLSAQEQHSARVRLDQQEALYRLIYNAI